MPISQRFPKGAASRSSDSPWRSDLVARLWRTDVGSAAVIIPGPSFADRKMSPRRPDRHPSSGKVGKPQRSPQAARLGRDGAVSSELNLLRVAPTDRSRGRRPSHGPGLTWIKDGFSRNVILLLGQSISGR